MMAAEGDDDIDEFDIHPSPVSPLIEFELITHDSLSVINLGFHPIKNNIHFYRKDSQFSNQTELVTKCIFLLCMNQVPRNYINILLTRILPLLFFGSG
jgi:hypothetical protein